MRTLYEHDAASGKSDFTVPTAIPVDVNNHHILEEIDVFVSALLSGGEMPVSSMEGASAVAVACATVEAAREGRPVNIRYPQAL